MTRRSRRGITSLRAMELALGELAHLGVGRGIGDQSGQVADLALRDPQLGDPFDHA